MGGGRGCWTTLKGWSTVEKNTPTPLLPLHHVIAFVENMDYTTTFKHLAINSLCPSVVVDGYSLV